MDGDWLIAGVALMKVIALQHASHSVARGKLDEIDSGEFAHPLAVKRDAGFFRIQNLEDLFLVGPGILEHLFTGQSLAGDILATRVADHACEIANQKDDFVPELLKLSELINEHCMT